MVRFIADKKVVKEICGIELETGDWIEGEG